MYKKSLNRLELTILSGILHVIPPYSPFKIADAVCAVLLKRPIIDTYNLNIGFPENILDFLIDNGYAVSEDYHKRYVSCILLTDLGRSLRQNHLYPKEEEIYVFRFNAKEFKKRVSAFIAKFKLNITKIFKKTA